MELSPRFRFWFLTFNHLLRLVLPTWLDNHVLIPLLGCSMYRRSQKTPSLKKPQLRFDGAVRDYGHFLRFGELTVNFDLSGIRRNTQKRRKPYKGWNFEDGFMRIEGRLSRAREKNLPFANLDGWTVAREPSPPAAVVHDEPVLLINDSGYHKWNPALILRVLYSYLFVLEACGIRPEDAIFLLFSSGRSEKLDALVKNLFKVKNTKLMRGVHLFHNAFYLFQSKQWGFQSRTAVDMMRRHLLPAFGITPRRRSEDVNRITLVSREDYEVEWGLNHVERKISNEGQIIEVLRRHFPDAEVRAVRLEQLPVVEQLQLVHETDVLIGMHGAALGFSTILPENAGLIELFPAHFLNRHWFTTFYLLAVGAGVHYRRWINFIPGRERCSAEHARKMEQSGQWSVVKRDFTEVPPQALLQRVKSVRRAMRRGYNRRYHRP